MSGYRPRDFEQELTVCFKKRGGVMQENWLWGFDQFINDITTTRGEDMSHWGDSRVATKYIYERINDILDMNEYEDVAYSLSRLMDELAHNYKVDTGKLIGEDL